MKHRANAQEWIKQAHQRVIDRIPKPIKYKQHEKRLVVTVATGDEFQKILSLTQPFMEDYARRCDADFLAITRTTQDFAVLEKFRIQPLVAAYDRTIFLDADCVVRPNARNLFDVVPKDQVGMHDDLLERDHRPWAVGTWHNLERSQHEDRPFLERLLNTGVIVVSRQHANIFTPPRYPIPGDHCDEQFWIDRNVHHFKHIWFNVPRELNLQYWYPDFADCLDTAEIVHFSACPGERRLQEIQKYIQNAMANTQSPETPDQDR